MTKSSMQLKSFVAPLSFMYGNIGHITDLVKHQPGCQNEMRMKKCNKVKNNIFLFCGWSSDVNFHSVKEMNLMSSVALICQMATLRRIKSLLF